MMNFCTLFDSYYLDKGIALYQSLEKASDDFHLYIFCFDDKSRDVLKSRNMKHATILHHTDIEKETEKLLLLMCLVIWEQKVRLLNRRVYGK